MEYYLIEHCSPTLAGLKTASLFNCPISSEKEFYHCVYEVSRQLNEKDVFVEVLRCRNNRALILVYRKCRLAKDLQCENAFAFLSRYGYRCCDLTDCMTHLKSRFAECNGFPHEIGLFLGYPLQDVVGFIKNKGKNSKCSGFWKVYGDEKNAAKLFERYNKCKEIYKKLFLKGKSVMQLTVAA